MLKYSLGSIWMFRVLGEDTFNVNIWRIATRKNRGRRDGYQSAIRITV